MKYAVATLVAVLAGQSLARPSPVVHEVTRVKRDVATISSAISFVELAALSLESAAAAYTGGPIDSVASAAANVLSVTNTETTAVNATSDISLTDAISLQSSLSSLQSTVNTTVDDIIAKKPQIVAAGAASQVESALQAQLSAADAFASAIVSKVPQAIQSLAASLAAPVAQNLQNGVNAFAPAATPTAMA